MRIYLLLTFVILLGLFKLFTYPVLAHFPATDGDMTVTLHIDPNDDPTPKQQANLYFLFDYAGKSFDLATCNCVVSISEQGKQIYKQTLIQKKYATPSIWGTNIPYIFPTSDVYHIVLSGRPKAINTFRSFNLSWDFRVDPNGDAGIIIQRPSDLPYLLGGAGVGIVFLFFFGWFIKKEVIDAEEVDNTKHSRYNKQR